jgi:hypothetical protein
MVAGRQVVVRGKVSGVVCGQTVALQASSQVEGDIHHMSFAIEQGAHFEGRSRRAKSEADLVAIIEGRGGSNRMCGVVLRARLLRQGIPCRGIAASAVCMVQTETGAAFRSSPAREEQFRGDPFLLG